MTHIYVSYLVDKHPAFEVDVDVVPRKGETIMVRPDEETGELIKDWVVEVMHVMAPDSPVEVHVELDAPYVYPPYEPPAEGNE